MSIQEKIRFDQILGKNILYLRKLKNLKQHDIANFLCVTHQQVNKYESGKNRISVENLKKVCSELFFVSLDQITSEHMIEQISTAIIFKKSEHIQ
tara:strand:+ start:2127 stop:2411 length:285 start_codon:yes stop_codon:yes gene_type:complete